MQADRLIVHATLVTMDPQRRILSDHGIAIRDGRIAAILPTQALLEQYSAPHVLDASGSIAYPGFINTHNHLFQMLLKNLGKDLGLIRWLDECIIAHYRNITPENIYWAALVGCAEQLHSGVTTCVDYQYAHGRPSLSDAVIKAFQDIGIRGVLARGHANTEDYPDPCKPPHVETMEDFFDDVRRLHSQYRSDPRIDVAIAPGIVWSLSEDGFRRCADLARELDTLLTIHTLETEEDNAFGLERHGVSTIEFYEKTGVLDTKLLAVHCALIQPHEVETLARHGVSVSYNAISNMLMGYQTLPVCQLLEHGIPVGLATDGAASNDSQNMLEVLKISALWQKAFYRDPTVLPAMRLLEMATIDGARSIHREKDLGSLEVGKRADLFLYDPMNCTTVPSFDPVTSIIYNASPAGVRTTLVEGEVVLEDGRLTRIEEARSVFRLQEEAALLREKGGLKP